MPLSISLFFETNDVKINIDELKSNILSLDRCKSNQKIKTRSISINKLISLLQCYRDEHKSK